MNTQSLSLLLNHIPRAGPQKWGKVDRVSKKQRKIYEELLPNPKLNPGKKGVNILESVSDFMGQIVPFSCLFLPFP